MKGRILLIEGLDLAGKSTLVRDLERELTRRRAPLRVSRNALCADNPVAVVADARRRDPEASLAETGALFLAAHLWDARYFTSPPPGVIHLQDSSWLRTLAFHRYHNTPGIPDLLGRAAVDFPRFDTAVFLTADIGERRRRLRLREREQPGSNDHLDHAVVLNVQGFLGLEAILREVTVATTGAQVIDTTDMSPGEVLDTALRVLGIERAETLCAIL